ncbi:hypothetical protein SeMB42_g04148 [Synchytrium endobioticum]|uniref:SH3 domain-containing protein n=1 Tax=Synchytrium endobioticum TaxID=286115 RepID=A0A507D352_9FUNG|nr:hypothetical protein SeMB42_g04148 [Synchytrium endobioticum]TPX45678.1 hypothetical protein SeLEV6574_g03720 [Synchytrium endobioticum]
MPFGTELWDQWRTVENYVDHNMQFFETLNSFLKKRVAIEHEYATALSRLVKGHKDEHQKRSTDRSAGSFQKAVLSSTVAQSWLQLLNETDNMALAHATIAERLETDVRKSLKKQLKENDKSNKTNFDEVRRVLADLRKAIEAMEKTRERYEAAMKGANAARSTYDAAANDTKKKKEDVDKIRLDMEKKSALEKESIEAYKRSIVETNDKKNKHYQEQLPAILDVIQRDDEANRIAVAKELFSKYAEIESAQIPTVTMSTQSMASTFQTISPRYDTDLFVKLMRTGDPAPPDYTFEGIATESVLKAFAKTAKAEPNLEESIMTLPSRKGRKLALERLKTLDENHRDLERRRQGYHTLLAVSPDISQDPKIQKDMTDQRALLEQQLEAVLIKKHKLHVYLATLDGVAPPAPPDLLGVKLSAAQLAHGTTRMSSNPPPCIDTAGAAGHELMDPDGAPRASHSASVSKLDGGGLRPHIPDMSPARRGSLASGGAHLTRTPSSGSGSTQTATPTVPANVGGAVSEPDSPAKADLLRKLMMSHQDARACKKLDRTNDSGSLLGTPLSSTDNIFAPAVTIGRAKALYEFPGNPLDPESSELPVGVGEEVDVVDKLDDGWWRVKKVDAHGAWAEGFVPGSYMQDLRDGF